MIDKKVYVSNFQRFSVHDGPGIRTVVFLLGCPLRCKWCQNPETLKPNPELMMNHALCSGCSACIEMCPKNAISMNESGQVVTDFQNCDRCWKCIGECYYHARQLTGKPYTVDEVLNVIKKDLIVYKNTGGGVTLSGGEPTLYTAFCYELFEKCKKDDIHTAMETCGFTDWENFEMLLKVTDLFLYDFKLFDSEKHKKYTSVDNEKILHNLEVLVKADAKVVIRIPLIPGVNDDEEFRRIVQFVRGLKKVESIHIMPFHQIGSSKYDMIGVDYQLRNLKEENTQNVEKCKKIAAEMGFRVSIGGAGFKEDAEVIMKTKSARNTFIYRG